MRRPSIVTSNPGRIVTEPATTFYVGSLNPGRLTVIGGAAAMFTQSGFEPPTKKSAPGCITIRPLLAMSEAPHCLEPGLPLTRPCVSV